ncbi:MAG: dienelactone hydrolase [Deltaproteobacteria bacterium]|nr:dienelactone hydrolase [Deltaproteobacteria bacterium]
MENRELTLVWSQDRRIRAVLGVPRTATMDAIIILGHGANNTMEHPLIVALHEGLAREGLVTVRFNFPYAEEGRSSPDRDEVLEGVYRLVVEYLGDHQEFRGLEMYLGGKSMGARLAAQIVAQDVGASGLVFLGYPLHPPGKPERLRDRPLYHLPCPALFIAGSRDPFCRLDLLGAVLGRMPVRTDLHLIPGVGHSFEEPGGVMTPEIPVQITRVILGWMESL